MYTMIRVVDLNLPTNGATTLTQNTISQILTKNYVDLHRVMSINQDNMDAYLYSAW